MRAWRHVLGREVLQRKRPFLFDCPDEIHCWLQCATFWCKVGVSAALAVPIPGSTMRSVAAGARLRAVCCVACVLNVMRVILAALLGCRRRFSRRTRGS